MTAAETGETRQHEHREQPEQHRPIGPVGKEIERDGPGSDEEHPDPDRPMGEPVTDLIAGAKDAVVGQLDTLGVSVLLRVRRWQQK